MQHSDSLPLRRLNLFAFRSETDTLFMLLLAAAVALAVSLSYSIAYLFFPSIKPDLSQLDLAAGLRGEQLMETLTVMGGLIAIPLLLIALIFGVAFFLYRQHPQQIRQRKQLQPLSMSDKDISLQRAVTALAEIAGVSPVPTIEMPTGKGGTNGQAFGLAKRYALRLDGGLHIWRVIKPARFRAIVLHELGHIVNGDIWRSYFTEALWRATLILSVLPVILGVLSMLQNVSGILTLLGLCIEIGITLAVILSIRARLLRTREYYADWRAVLWGEEAALKEIFKASTTDKNTTSSRYDHIFGHVWRLHPTVNERLNAIQHPESLFNLSWVLPFSVGFLLAFLVGSSLMVMPVFYTLVLEPLRVMRIELGIAYQGNPVMMTLILFWLARGAWFLLFFSGLLMVFIPMAWLISGVIGTQVVKNTAVTLVDNQHGIKAYLRLGILAVALIGGWEVGVVVMPWGVNEAHGSDAWVLEILLTGVMLVAIWSFLAYVRFTMLHLFAGEHDTVLPAWRKRFSTFVHNSWLIALVIPGFMFQRLLVSQVNDVVMFPMLLLGFSAWIMIGICLGLIMLGFSWGLFRWLNEHSLGKWMFVPEDINIA
jgi:Zn-dependent protease with chaperone function